MAAWRVFAAEAAPTIILRQPHPTDSRGTTPGGTGKLCIWSGVSAALTIDVNGAPLFLEARVFIADNG